jgi:hypothetical protein
MLPPVRLLLWSQDFGPRTLANDKRLSSPKRCGVTFVMQFVFRAVDRGAMPDRGRETDGDEMAETIHQRRDRRASLVRTS